MDIKENDENRGEYWNKYYDSRSAPIIPSQFAVFFANEINPKSSVIELGSGNGRDSFFFSKIVNHVIAVDGSEVAVNNCKNKAIEDGLNNIDLLHSLIDDPELFSELEKILLNSSASRNSLFVYSRFFLHSINEDEENKMILLISKLLDSYTGSAYLEFRTEEDKHLSKYTGAHFRRYVAPKNLINKFNNMNFSIDYHVEGLGYAKHKVDDAHAARLVVSKNRS